MLGPSSGGHCRGRWHGRALFVDTSRTPRRRAHDRSRNATGRVPVIAGVGFNASLGAPAAGVRRRPREPMACSCFRPYYPNADDEGVLDVLPAHRGRHPLGLLIYSRDWFHPGPSLVDAAGRDSDADRMEGRAGGHPRLQILMHAVGDRLQWIGGAGDDLVPAYYAAGVRGYTSSVSNVAPRLSLALHEQATAGDAAACSRSPT